MGSDATESQDDGRRRVWVLAGAALLSVAATVWFLLWEPRPVRVGWHPTDYLVPWYYQVSVFPAFGAFASAALYDWRTRRTTRSWSSRLLLLVATSAIAVLRLLGLLPLSGHAVFLCAMLVHELTADRRARTPLGTPLVAAGLAVTVIYKLAWQDYLWGGASVLVGALISGVSLWLVRRGVKP